MTIFRALAISGTILACAGTVAFAAVKPGETKPSVSLAAEGLIDTFAESCVAYAGRDAQLKVWLDANMQPADDHQAPYFLGQMAGKVWLSRNIVGNYAVIVYDLGLCTVKAETAPIDDALAGLEQQAGGKLHLKLAQTADDASGVFADISGHVRTYSTQIDGVDYAIIASGTQHRGNPLQSQFTLVLAGDDDDSGQPAK